MVRITNIKTSEKRYLRDRATLPARKTCLHDRIEIPNKPSTRFKDSKGNLTFDMDICRDGVQEYMADEIYDAAVLKENGIDIDTILRVWRPPNVVFSDTAIAAHNGLPLTREHPKESVDTNNRPYLEKGINRGSFYDREKSVISGTGFVSDALMVTEIDSGEFNEISDGYDSELDFKPGVVPSTIDGPDNVSFRCTDAGQEYDLIMSGYYPNHIAMVKEGRAGVARIHDNEKIENKDGGNTMAGFFEKLNNKNKQKKIKDTIKKVGRGATLRMLADEEPDEEKKAALEALAEDAETEDACETEDAETETEDDLNSSTALSNSETKDGDGDQKEVEIAEQKRVVDDLNLRLKTLKDEKAVAKTDAFKSGIDIEIKDIETKLADSTDTGNKTTEVLDMKTKELAELISVTVNDALDKRLGDAGKDITLDGEPTVVEEFEVEDNYGMDMNEPQVVDEFEVEDMGGEIGAEALYELAKNSQDPAVAALARNLAQKIEGAAAEAQTEEMPEGTDDGFVSDMVEEDMQVDAPPATEEARLASAAEGDAPEAGTPSNQAKESELEAGTKDGETEGDIVKDDYFIPKKLADAAALPVLMGNVIDTVSAFGIQGIDVQAHLKDGTIYHRLIDASGIGKITASKGITADRVTMAMNAIRANRQKVDGVATLFDSKNLDSSSKEGFDPANEL